jgi:uncharacterized membrane protein (DUF106 family)
MKNDGKNILFIFYSLFNLYRGELFPVEFFWWFLMVFISPAIDIGLISLALVVVSRFLQSKLVNKEKQKAAQQRMKEKQKRMKELIANNDERSKNEAAALQREMFAEMGESMQGSMRYMMVSLPFFLVVYAALGFYYGGLYFDALFPIPKFQGWLPVGLATKTGWFKWYFFNYLIASIVLGIVLKIWVKAREEKKAGLNAEAK